MKILKWARKGTKKGARLKMVHQHVENGQRFPANRHFTNPYWIIPVLFWIIATLSLCIICILFGHFNWIYSFQNIDSGCSKMHEHLASYLINYPSFLVALSGAMITSLVYCLLLQNMADCIVKGTAYFTIISATSFTLLIWVLPPDEDKLTCGQSLFSVVITLGYVGFVFWIIYRRRLLPLVTSLHLVMTDAYRDLPSIRIGLVTFLFQLICIALNVVSMGVAVSVLNGQMNIGKEILTYLFSIFFMLLEGWLFIIIITCNKFVCGYVIGRWYFTKHKTKIKGVGRSFLHMWLHIATISYGSIYLFLHTLFKPIIDSVYYGNSSGVEGVLKSIVTLVLQPFRKTYDTINEYGFYMVALYGLEYYSAMRRSTALHKIGKKYMVTLMGDTFVYICVLLVSSLTVVFGMIVNAEGRMRWWKNIILLFLTGLWVSLSFLLTFKHMNAAYYMCVCIDYEEKAGKGKPFLYSKKMEQYLRDKEAFGLKGKAAMII